MPRPQPSLLVLACATACATTPAAPIPDPLPETLAWAAERPAEAPGPRAFLGLEVRENDSGSLEALAFEPGARVTRVVEGSPAAAAGFQVGDVVLRLDGVAVADPTTLAALLDEAATEAPHEVEARRGDSAFRVPVRLRAAEDAAPAAELLWRADPARSRAAWLAGRGGVVLVGSAPDGPFPAAGVPVGSVVTALDGEEVRSERALIRALVAREPGARVDVGFRLADDDAEHSATVRLHAPARRVTDATLPVLAGYRQSADGEAASAYLLDLWIISLFRYRREGSERHYRFLRFFTFSTGVGELAGGPR